MPAEVFDSILILLVWLGSIIWPLSFACKNYKVPDNYDEEARAKLYRELLEKTHFMRG